MSVDIRKRLSELNIEVSKGTTSMHLSAITAELHSPSPIPPRHYCRRRLPIVVLAAVLLVALTAAGSFAAEGAISGDRLFPVKQATEWIRAWIDPTVPAGHRIDELETLIDRRAAHEAIADQLQRAEDAVTEVSVGDAVVDAPLVDRLDTVRDRVPTDIIEPAPVVPDEPVAEPSDTLPPRPDRDAGDADDGRGDALGERSEHIAELCKKVAASDRRSEEFPAWLLRRCRHLVAPPEDSSDSP